MCRRVKWVSRRMLVLLWAFSCIVAGQRQLQSARPAATADSPEQAVIGRFIKRNCVDCHNSEDRTGGLARDAIGSKDLSQHSLAWEKVVRMLRARRMPPAEVPRPDERSYQAVLAALESSLDNAAAAEGSPRMPNPSRVIKGRNIAFGSWLTTPLERSTMRRNISTYRPEIGRFDQSVLAVVCTSTSHP